jgi:hypothetical protein
VKKECEQLGEKQEGQQAQGKGGGQRVHPDTGVGTGPSAALSVVTVVGRIGVSRGKRRRKKGEDGRRGRGFK